MFNSADPDQLFSGSRSAKFVHLEEQVTQNTAVITVLAAYNFLLDVELIIDLPIYPAHPTREMEC